MGRESWDWESRRPEYADLKEEMLCGLLASAELWDWQCSSRLYCMYGGRMALAHPGLCKCKCKCKAQTPLTPLGTRLSRAWEIR